MGKFGGGNSGGDIGRRVLANSDLSGGGSSSASGSSSFKDEARAALREQMNAPGLGSDARHALVEKYNQLNFD